jgi:hypothetical protein
LLPSFGIGISSFGNDATPVWQEIDIAQVNQAKNSLFWLKFDRYAVGTLYNPICFVVSTINESSDFVRDLGFCSWP